MSDLLTVRQKVIDGIDWTKEISVTLDGEDYTLTIRQLTDSEFFPIYETLDIEQLQEFASENESDEGFERLQELRNKDELSDAEEAERNKLEQKVTNEQGKIIDVLGQDGFEALQEAGKKAVVPDDEDVKAVMELPLPKQREMLGEVPNTDNEARRLLKQDVEKVLDNSISLLAFNVGIQAFMETLGEEGN